MRSPSANANHPVVEVTTSGGEHCLEFSGHWTLESMPDIDLATWLPSSGSLSLKAPQAEVIDTSLAMTVTRVAEAAEEKGLHVDLSDLPHSVSNLVRLARAVPEQDVPDPPVQSLVTRAGKKALDLWDSFRTALDFCGEAALAVGRTLKSPRSFRIRDFLVLLGDCGFRGLPIVSLLAFLTGLILAFVGAIQLRMFGADVYVADLVGLAMSREMASLMTAMIMSGRSGAAFAAHLGTMKVSEEIDALATFGFKPIDMLALPRLLALTFMMPLLTLYANMLGYFGGAVIGFSMLDISFAQYLFETQTIVTTRDISIGLAKSAVFGFIIAACGCVQGLNCGNDAASVGRATTRSVVLSITLIVVADAVFAVLCEVLKI